MEIRTVGRVGLGLGAYYACPMTTDAILSGAEAPGADYAATAGMRPPAEAQGLMHWMILAQALFGVAFAWVYFQGKEDRPWLAQGVRFGIAIALLTVIPTYLIYHVVTPVSLDLAIKQIVYDTIRVVLMGVTVAWINR